MICVVAPGGARWAGVAEALSADAGVEGAGLGGLARPRDPRVSVGRGWLSSRGHVSPGDLEDLAEPVGRRAVVRSKGPSFVLYYLASTLALTVGGAAGMLLYFCRKGWM